MYFSEEMVRDTTIDRRALLRLREQRVEGGINQDQIATGCRPGDERLSLRRVHRVPLAGANHHGPSGRVAKPGGGEPRRLENEIQRRTRWRRCSGSCPGG